MSKKDVLKVPRSDFEIFKKRFLQCVEEFGLRDWRITFLQENLHGHFAEIRRNESYHIVTVVLTTEIEKENMHEYNPVVHAEHEALHLITSDLYYHARCRYVRPDDLDNAEEVLVHRLQNILSKVREKNGLTPRRRR